MKNTILAAFLFCFMISNAQVSFEKGYFINNSGTKTECYIENLDWRSNPTSFNYKINLADSEVKLENIAGVSEFGIDNQSIYRRFAVNIERSQTTTSNLQKTKNPAFKKETLFLHALVTGEANLYIYTDGNVTKYFFETPKNPIEQLIYIRYLNENVEENNQFKQQLRNAVQCGEMTDDDFSRLKYDKNVLSKHFIAYNKCNGGSQNTTDYNKIADENRETFALRVVGGAYLATLKSVDPDPYYSKNGDIKNTVFKIGIEAEYILPFNKGAWSLFASAYYHKFDATKDFINNINNPGFANHNQPVHYTQTVEYTSIEIPLGLRRYFFLNPSAKIFVNLAYVIDLSGSGTLVYTNAEGLVNANQYMPLNGRNNPAVGLGFVYKRLSAEVRYNMPRRISSEPEWDVNYSSVGLNLAFKLL